MKIFFRTFLVIFLVSFFYNVNAQNKVKTNDTIRNVKDTIQSGNRFLVFRRTEIPASFPGGNRAWKKYISDILKQNKDSLTGEDQGTCIVKFIVHVSGDVSKVEATTLMNTRLAKIAVAAIKNGPKWVPARQNKTNVNAYQSQFVTFKGF